MTYFIKQPVAFRLARTDPATAGETIGNGAWRYFSDEAEARYEAQALGVDYDGLYMRDGSAIVGEWSDIQTAPKEPDATFLVCAVGDPRGPFVVRADIMWQARKAGTPHHLGLSYLTHWMPLPAMPQSSSAARSP